MNKSALEKDLENLEKEIESIANENTQIVQRIEKKIINKTKLKKYFYDIIKPELTLKSNEIEQFTLTVREEIDKIEICDIVTNWKIPSGEEKPIEVDPDKTLYGTCHDIMDNKCENFEDLTRWNKQLKICKNYLTMLRESVSIKFGLKFKKNFEIVQHLLSLVENEIKEDEKSKINEIEVKINDINRQILNLFEIKGVCSNKYSSNIPSTILTDIMKKSLAKMCAKSINCVLLHDQTRGQSHTKFHNAVNNKGPTLIVIKSTTGYVFGAYVHETFTSRQNSYMSENTFIFTFRNNNTAIKLLPSSTQPCFANSSCGLHLATDLVAFCSFSCYPQMFTKIAPDYSTNLAVNNTLLAGAETYSPQHMEIFSVSFV